SCQAACWPSSAWWCSWCCSRPPTGRRSSGLRPKLVFRTPRPKPGGRARVNTFSDTTLELIENESEVGRSGRFLGPERPVPRMSPLAPVFVPPRPVRRRLGALAVAAAFTVAPALAFAFGPDDTPAPTPAPAKAKAAKAKIKADKAKAKAK